MCPPFRVCLSLLPIYSWYTQPSAYMVAPFLNTVDNACYGLLEGYAYLLARVCLLIGMQLCVTYPGGMQ